MKPHIFKDLHRLKQAITDRDQWEAQEKLEIIQQRLQTREYPDIHPDTDTEYIQAGLSSIKRDINQDWSRAQKLVHLVTLEAEKLLKQGPDKNLDLGIADYTQE